jgi:hypothetical protein
MARLVAASRPEGLACGLAARPELGAMTAWISHEGIGAARAAEIALNVFVPFLGRAAWERAAVASPPASLPGLLERAASGPVTTVRRYFGALRSLKRKA